MEDLTSTQELRRLEIIKDIIKKRPEEHGCTYTEESYYDYERNYQRTRMVPSHSFYGHDPEELEALDLGRGGYLLRGLICDVYDKAITQKVNRFEERICEPLREHVRTIGVPGLYSVRTSSTNVGHVYAISREEARRVADITYGFLIAGKSDRWGDPETLRVNFKQVGTVADIGANNQRDIEQIRSRIASAKETIEQAHKSITQYEAELVAIQMSELSQLGSTLEEDAA